MSDLDAPPTVEVYMPSQRYSAPLMGWFERGFDEAEARRIITRQIRARVVENAFKDIDPIRMRRAIEWADQSAPLIESLETLCAKIAHALDLKWETLGGYTRDALGGDDRNMVLRIGCIVDEILKIAERNHDAAQRAELKWRHGQ